MRWLAIALLLANVGLFAWQYSRQVDDAARAVVAHQPLPEAAPPLRQLTELPELPPLKSPSAGPGPVSDRVSEIQNHAVPLDRCLDLGPFIDASRRDALREWLRSYTAALHSRTENLRKRRFFWVYLEPSTDDASARRSLDDLRQRGVTDYMLIRRGELRNAISLGLFRSQDSVNRRLAEMSEKGYTPVVVPRFETSERYWLSVQLASTAGDAFAIPEELLAPASARTIDCGSL